MSAHREKTKVSVYVNNFWKDVSCLIERGKVAIVERYSSNVFDKIANALIYVCVYVKGNPTKFEIYMEIKSDR